MKYAQMRTSIYGKCKSSRRKIASNLLWWEVKYYSDDAAETLTSQAPDGLSAPCMPPASTHTLEKEKDQQEYQQNEP
jgi:hypothetical protein